MTITGECFCGAVKYKIEGRLTDARSCHCSRCRKAFNAQASAYALVSPEEFSWLQGEALLTSFIDEGVSEGAPDDPDRVVGGLKFCSRCGSTLCGFYAGRIHGVTLGCVNGDPGITLNRHIFTGSKASWEDIGEGGQVPQYEEWPPEAGS